MIKLYSFALLMLLLVSCSKGEKPSVESTVIQTELTGGASSIDSLMILFVDGLNRRDSTLLSKLLISEYEHNELLLPEFYLHYPAVTKENQDVIWTNLSNRTLKGFLYLMGNMTGKSFRYETVIFEDPVEEYKTYSIHTNSIITLSDSTGKKRDLKLFGSVVEKNGRFKLLSYKEH